MALIRKILFVHDGPISYDNSSQRFYGVSYSDKLVKRYLLLGDQVTFLMRLAEVSPERAKQLSPILEPSFSFIEIPNFKSISRYFAERRKAIAIIENAVKNHDLLVIRLPSAAGTIAFKKAREFNKPVLVEFVSCVYDALWNYDWRGKLIAHYRMWQQKRLMKKVPYTIYVTKEFLQKRYPTNGQFIHCSDVELQGVNANEIKNRLLRIESTDLSKKLIIGTIAAIDVKYKGQADVIKAIAKLKRQGNIFHYHLVGQGDPEKLNRLAKRLGIADQIKIIGPLKHKEVFDFLESIDIYIQPSKTEGLPRALIEAMSKACPAFGSKVGGIPELLSEEMTFQPGNIEELSRKLFLLNKEILTKQAKRNFEEAKNYQKKHLDSIRFNFYAKFLKNEFKES